MFTSGMIDGFERRRLPGFGIEIDALVGGSGPPVLLLHGYPQTRMIWKAVAARLAEHFTLVMPDLRGYGRSDKPRGNDGHESYAKRLMALDQIETMKSLGFRRFAVAGHDRGGRLAYRLALDHPAAIEKLAVLDINPTGDQFAAANAAIAMKSYHWYMLAQPFPLPERLIGGNPEFFIRYTLESWAAGGFQFDPECLEDYIRCFDEASVHATCEDYRAGWTLDRQQDEADRGVKFIQAPTLCLWAEGYHVASSNPLERWRRWAKQVCGSEVPGGHFVCEESPRETGAALLNFFE